MDAQNCDSYIILAWLTLQPESLRLCTLRKLQEMSTRLHCVIFQRTALLIVF